MRTKRCPACDQDGEVLNSMFVYVKCPRCEGTRKVEAEPMNEEDMYRWLMVTAAILAALCGLGAVGLIILCAVGFSWGVLVCALLLTLGAVCSGYTTVYFSTKTTVPKVFNNQDEREVLNNKQRRELKKARGEVVMTKAMIEVQHEQENIVHNQMIEAGDDTTPPHLTRWSDRKILPQSPRLGKNEDDR